MAASWDMLIVDEAHRLECPEAAPNPGVSNDRVPTPENEGRFAVAATLE